MRNPLQAALDFAVAESQEAESLFKEWAAKVDDPEIQALFAEWAAVERGRTEMLSRMIPEELTARLAVVPELADLLARPKTGPVPTLEKAVGVAIRRKGVTAALYDRIAELGGEACSFFRAMSNDDRRTVCALEAYLGRLRGGCEDVADEGRPDRGSDCE